MDLNSMPLEQRVIRLEKAVERLKEQDEKRYSTYYAAVKRRRYLRQKVEQRANSLVKTYSQASGIVQRMARFAKMFFNEQHKDRHLLMLSSAERIKLFSILHTDYRKK